jgi:hypothetical protein
MGPEKLAGVLAFLGARAHEDEAIQCYLAAPEQRAQIDRLVTIGRRQIDSFNPPEIASSLLGLAFLRRGEERFAHLLLARGTGLLGDFEPLDAVTMLGAVRHVGGDVSCFLVQMRGYIAARKNEFDSPTLARAAKFLTQLQQPLLAREIVAVAAQRIEDFESRDLWRLAVAASRLGEHGTEFIPVLAGEVTDRLMSRPDGIVGRDAITVLSLLGHQRLRDEPFLSAFAHEMAPRLAACSPAELREIAWSYAALREFDERLLKQLGRIVACRVTEFETSDVAMIVQSFAVLNYRHDELLIATAEHLDDRYETFSARQCAMIAWGFAPFDGRLSQRVIAQAGAAFPEAEAAGPAQRQMHIALVASGQRPPGRCPAVVSEMAAREAAGQRANDFERSVAAAFRAIDRPGLEIHSKMAIEGIVTDFVVINGDRRFVIECDGARFHLTSAGIYCGNDTLQDRVFARCGFTVVHLLCHEFRHKSPRELELCLCDKLGIGRLPNYPGSTEH